MALCLSLVCRGDSIINVPSIKKRKPRMNEWNLALIRAFVAIKSENSVFLSFVRRYLQVESVLCFKKIIGFLL